MDTKELVRHILGYAIGFTMFAAAIPAALVVFFWIFSWLTPFSLIPVDALKILVTAALLAAGLTFAIWSNLWLLLVGKGGPADGFGVAVSPRTKKLVSSGPYRYTRNPMVFGALCCYMALAVYLNSPVCVLLVAAGSVAVTFYLRAFEEQRLLKDFGPELEEYRKRTSMIIPLPPKKA